jgi:hypothetical protein
MNVILIISIVQERPWDKNRILKDSFDFELKIEEFLHIIFD